MTEAAIEMLRMFRLAGTGNLYWPLCVAASCFLAAHGRNARRHLVYPLVWGIVLLFNPLSCLLWNRISYSNWRLLWMIPVTGIISAAAVCLIGRIRNAGRRLAVGILTLVLIAAAGSPVWQTAGTQFSNADNPMKIPAEAETAARILLDQERYPRAVVSSGLYCYIRQYSSDIFLLYGRDAEEHYIHRISEENLRVFRLMDRDTPAFADLREEMSRLGYPYLVIQDGGRYREADMNAAGFRKLAEAGNYSVYRVI